MDEKKLYLRKLIEHWVEHNDEHGRRYDESAAEAEIQGLHGAAKKLRKASQKAREASNHLRKALTQLEEGG